MTWKRTIRPVTDRVARYSGVLRACERRMRSKITVLMYHRVLEDADCADYPFPSLVMSRSLFEAQLSYLAKRARVLPVLDALCLPREAAVGSKPLVCLTFDDGYVDNFEIVAPLLEKCGLRGSFYVTAGAVRAREQLWYDLAAAIWMSVGEREIGARVRKSSGTSVPEFETRESWIEWLKTLPQDRRRSVMGVFETGVHERATPCPLMSVDQVQQLAERGHEIGSHTLWHPILTTMAEEERRNEIKGARRLLQEWTGGEVAGFCYPNGDLDSEVIREVQEAGHSYSCTTQPGCNDECTDRFQLRRIDVTRDRVAAPDGSFDQLGFRAEISLLREVLRGWPCQ